MPNFDFLEKDVGIVTSPYFAYDFSRKMFLLLFSINWPNCIVWLHLLLEILGNMCIAIVYFAGCDAISFEINLIFLIRPFFYKTKKFRQKFKYLENEKSFKGEMKKHFSLFCTLDVSQTMSYKITRPSVCWSVCSSVTKFYQDWIISFFWYSAWW